MLPKYLISKIPIFPETPFFKRFPNLRIIPKMFARKFYRFRSHCTARLNTARSTKCPGSSTCQSNRWWPRANGEGKARRQYASLPVGTRMCCGSPRFVRRNFRLIESRRPVGKKIGPGEKIRHPPVHQVQPSTCTLTRYRRHQLKRLRQKSWANFAGFGRRSARAVTTPMTTRLMTTSGSSINFPGERSCFRYLG